MSDVVRSICDKVEARLRRVLLCRQCGQDMPVEELPGAYRCPLGHVTLIEDGEPPW